MREEKEALVRWNVGRGSAALCGALALACGDTKAVPLYGASGPIRVDAGTDGAAKPCLTDQPLVLVATTPSSVSRPGALSSAAPIEQYAPRPVGVRLTTAAGAPVGGCDVSWTPAPGSGWVFPIAQATDADGRVEAWWTAGADASQTLRAAVADGRGGGASVTMSAAAEPRRTRATRVYLEYPVDAFDAYSIEVIPEVASAGSAIGALWTRSCGAGLSSDFEADGGVPTPRAFAFCWDSNTEATSVIDASGSSCGAIASDNGTRGTQCAQPFAWKLGAPYRFDLETRHTIAGHTDYVFYVGTDGADRTKLVELRFGSDDRPSAAFSYLQKDPAAPSCLETERLSALFRKVTQIDADVAADVRAATFTRDYDVAANVICANYFYGVSQGAFMLSTGSDLVGPPRPPGWPAPSITLP
jgi:hypothetical protein